MARRVLRQIAAGALAFALATPVSSAAYAHEDGLLFHLSADKSTTADVARGDATPNFEDHVAIVPNGARGAALSTQDDGILTYNAARNIYGQRGTVSFFWRSRYPVGEAPFPIFRVGFADHTSWDMVWLRIDYNGHGFDAFVTDNNLARTRVSFAMPVLPKDTDWTHLAFAWDETQGVKLYVNGKLVARNDTKAVYDTGLDQFGFATRAVSPHQVQSRYNFMRGGDFDELRIYDHALDAGQLAALARGDAPIVTSAAARDLNDPQTRSEWDLRYGWNRRGDTPVELTAPVTAIRKVEFVDAKDKKEWMYKATDGIAETTWPGVYNRSRLLGRNDYFTLPDWNVYVEGGKALTLTLPEEPWNHVEIEGAAYGTLSYATTVGGAIGAVIATRAKDQQRTFHQFSQSRRGGVLTFTNVAQETPIQEIEALNITDGGEPEGTAKLSYTVRATAGVDSPDLGELKHFIEGRYPADEASTVVALPDGAPQRSRKPDGPTKALPLVHILIPYEFGASPADKSLYRSWNYGWENMHDALDGVAIDLPAFNAKPNAEGVIPLNIQIKDPIWPMRNLIEVSVSVKPNAARTIWLDTRDRILPNRSLYLSIASGSVDFNAATLDGAKIRLVFKSRETGRGEHIADRLAQLKDNWGYLVEEHTASKREALYRRLVEDATDLFRVDPDNRIGREYWADIMYGSQAAPAFVQPSPPAGEPLWAYRQLEDLKSVKQFVNWWIDNRQVPYGDFGGGISDDTDLVEQWPGLALMGVDTAKIKASHMALADAVYKNGMFTDGLSTIATDELHSYEDGINSNSEAMYLNWGDPKVVERLMTTVKAYDRVIMRNGAGHLHFASSWFSGSKVYREGPWEWSKYYSYLLAHPGILMGIFNSDPTSRRVVTGLADGLLAHGKQDPQGKWRFPDEINWRTDAERGTLPANTPPMQLFWAAYRWTGDDKYLRPIMASIDKSGIKAIADLNENLMFALNKTESWGAAAVQKADSGKASELEKILAWQASGNRHYLETLYGDEMRQAAQRMFMMTEGHWWSDRVEINSQTLQRTRLGGVALRRNYITPGHTVSWGFTDGEAEQVAILVENATPTHFTVVGYNTSNHPISARMTAWNVAAGDWTMTIGADAPKAAGADQRSVTRAVRLERSAGLDLTFPARQTVRHAFTLTRAGDPPETRADLGIGSDDVEIKGQTLSVTVHSLGAKDAPAGSVTLTDAAGKMVVTLPTPPLKAPTDLLPKTAVVTLNLPAGVNLHGAMVRVALPPEMPEVTQLNNVVILR